MERTDRGTLIAVEGIDGAGKTTQVGLLVHFLQSAGLTVTQSKEPTDGPWGARIRASAANGRMSPMDELNAFIEDRKEHTAKVIAPALGRGETVILDRYFYSTIAYQGLRTGRPDQVAAQMFDLALEPDAVILIDTPPEVGRSRIKNGRKEKPNAFEELEHLRGVRKVFLDLAEGHKNVAVIDGTPSVHAVHHAILRSLVHGILKDRHCAKAYGCDAPEYCTYRISDTCTWARMVARVSAAH
jgi:dTMP kinase